MRAMSIFPFGSLGQLLLGAGLAVVLLGHLVVGLAIAVVGTAFAVPRMRAKWRARAARG